MGADLLGDSDDLTSLDRVWRRHGRDTGGQAPAPRRRRSRSPASDRDAHLPDAHTDSSAGTVGPIPHHPAPPHRYSAPETGRRRVSVTTLAPAPMLSAWPGSRHHAVLAPAAARPPSPAPHPGTGASGRGPPRHHPGPRSDREMRRSQLDLLVLDIRLFTIGRRKPLLEQMGSGTVTAVTIVTGYQR